MCAFRPHCPISTGSFHFRTAKTPPPRPLAPCPRLPALSYAVRVINTTKNHTRRRAVPTVRKPCRQSRRRAHPFAVRKPCRRVRIVCRRSMRRGNRGDGFGNGHGFGRGNRATGSERSRVRQPWRQGDGFAVPTVPPQPFRRRNRADGHAVKTKCAYNRHTFPRRMIQPWRGSTFTPADGFGNRNPAPFACVRFK